MQLKQLRSYHVGHAHVSLLSLSSTNTTFFPKPPTTFLTCFSRGHREARKCQKESSPQPGIKLTTTRSCVRHAHPLSYRDGARKLRMASSGKWRKC